ncbi:MFS transporter [Metapseudomonas resinovorans]|uniref:Putative major facilitator superfamily transporter n=1 Tax=Metapseudomonas resinovorans NBRC 106553 TaxID=1245471 RepID=S6AQJ5_METRE|nr:MFS transporter [Pseudomonas resinovorans]BAN46091.1 putative major facilitator superfamily transporter [Pseudomonas resinovorans NBRC 106553]
MNAPSDNRRPLVVALLMAVMVISVLDKSIFAFAGPQIIDELKLSPEQFGFIGSAFFFLYSLSGVLVGFLANRLPSRHILAGMSLVWMVAQLLTALSSSFFALVASRMLLGAGCGPGTAVTQHACFKWYAPRERVLPSALIQVALMLGAIAGALSLPLLIEHLGWRMGYLLLAAIGLVWLLLWRVYGREGEHDDAEGETGGGNAPYRQLLLNRTFVFITLAGFCCYLPTALIFSWVPVYLQKGMALTPMQSGYVVMAATVGVIILNLLVSGLSQRALKRGASVRLAMVMPPMLACLGAGVAMSLMGFLEQGLGATLALYVVGGILVNLLPTFANSIVAFIAPPRQRGSMLAIHIGLMTSAGMLAPHVVGQAIGWAGGDIAKGFELAVGLFGLALIAGGALGLRLIDPERSRAQLASHTTESVNAPAPSQA